ncbi:AbrB/MazE/SpoVT family DNA-binding domain-containing protein [Sphingomonas corticis]|jgi:antitoxin VapB|uniref:AbrB/MazE/SpoVT family DNA-binding domain-containing protein n=1 Tax=Sphingomonas corticis TaxID=2722791 RepID=A0ABX1CPN3_9SPHN|nr:AbrB/MazE/SpoVT family DNA-binding domain-containing protein [Sphingomonas corticis]NJR79434.1 AbrB/MazE/SpoVT family DNA-binding domain-containing protein [Sphingomonas corticis]
MDIPDRSDEHRRKAGWDRVVGSMPWLRVRDRKHYRVKVFKSGNSLAVRLPAGLDLRAGMEMELDVEDGHMLTLEPVERPKRKFNVAKVCGSATSLQPIADDDRSFDDRPLRWSEQDAE